MSDERFDISKLKHTYTPQSIGGATSDIEAVRKRPARWLGSSGVEGIVQQVKEMVENAVDESTTVHHLSGNQSHLDIHVEFFPDASILVKDQGRGLPSGYNNKFGMETVYLILERDTVGGKNQVTDDNVDGYKGVSTGGVHGAGMCATLATCEYFHLKNAYVDSDGVYEVRYEKGERVIDYHKVSDFNKVDGIVQTGTEIRLKYDEDILNLVDSVRGYVKYPYDIQWWINRLKGYALEGDGFTIHFYYTLPDKEREYMKFDTREITFMNRLKEYSDGSDPETLTLSDEELEYTLEINIVPSNKYRNLKYSSVNMLQMQRSSHAEAFEEVFQVYMERRLHKDKKYNRNYPIRDVSRYISYMLRLKVRLPEFAEQSKFTFNNARIKHDVKNKLNNLLNSNQSKVIEGLYEKIKVEYESYVKHQKLIEQERLAEQKQLEELQKRKANEYTPKELNTLTEKLIYPLERDMSKCSIVIIEGDGAKTVILPHKPDNYGVLPVQGKVINVIDRSNITKIAKSELYHSLAYILSLGWADIRLMMDGDADGRHIRSLIYGHLAINAPQYLREGRVYIIEAPYATGTLQTPFNGKGIGERYLFTSEIELNTFYKNGGFCINLEAYKGLGGLPATIKEELIKNPNNHIKLNPETIEEGIDELGKWLSVASEYKKNYVRDTMCTTKLKTYLIEKQSRPSQQTVSVNLNTLKYDFTTEPDYGLL